MSCCYYSLIYILAVSLKGQQIARSMTVISGSSLISVQDMRIEAHCEMNEQQVYCFLATEFFFDVCIKLKSKLHGHRLTNETALPVLSCRFDPGSFRVPVRLRLKRLFQVAYTIRLASHFYILVLSDVSKSLAARHREERAIHIPAEKTVS